MSSRMSASAFEDKDRRRKRKSEVCEHSGRRDGEALKKWTHKKKNNVSVQNHRNLKTISRIKSWKVKKVRKKVPKIQIHIENTVPWKIQFMI
jgi:hypothetical protein